MNIGRLHAAHDVTNPQTGVYKVYYEGMGRRLSDETVGVPKTLGRNSLDQAKSVAKSDFITGPAKKGVQDAAKEIIKDWKGGQVSSGARPPALSWAV